MLISQKVETSQTFINSRMGKWWCIDIKEYYAAMKKNGTMNTCSMMNESHKYDGKPDTKDYIL